ncbi:major capsid protein [Spirosoma validum]|uniref:Major capsid protein n=1 Tax=Spirosoma validum TaxID=2771355 RepID=A0A927GDQ2_9BACT|nr:major capsid protein [Spirosoma validum]MBD2753790.1 major capsid protein [Spirosoma validum]
MSKLSSIFGVYASRLQIVIDTSLGRFDPFWYTQYFDMGTTQNTLTFESVIGRQRIEAAASIVNRESSSPVRSRQGVEKVTGELPAIKEKMRMSETNYRDFLMMQNMTNIDNDTRLQQLMDFLFGDVRIVGNSAHKRLDIMALEAVSTGKISLTTTNNPDGLIYDQSVDLLMPDSNRVNATTTWATAASAKPLDDIETIVVTNRRIGRRFAKMLMTYELFYKMKATAQVKDTMNTFYYGPKAAGASPQAVTTLERINEYLTSQSFPIIELVDEAIGIEKDGVITTYNAFNVNNVSFVPAGKLGTIKNAWAIEQIQKVEKVSYGTFNKALISKWQENDPFSEWTNVELNAMPSLDAIDGIVILTAVL